jgi:NAD-dependent oxidoreductase involved in siderophore biosynthesis
MFRTGEQFCFALSIAVMTFYPLSSARADFFDDARQTFQKDVPHFFQSDVPHFFQDDIPCAFGGQPTSHTKTSCKSPQNSVRQGTNGKADGAPVQQDEGNSAQEPTVYDQ